MDYQEAVELCNDILTLCDDLPERAAEFGESITNKVLEMKEWISVRQHVTGNMIDSLENMKSGVEKWLR